MGSKRRRRAPSEEMSLDGKEHRALSDISSCSQGSEDSKGRSPSKTPKKRASSVDSSVGGVKKKGANETNNKNMPNISETDGAQKKAVKDRTSRNIEETDSANKVKSKPDQLASGNNDVGSDSSSTTGATLKTPKKKNKEKKLESSGKDDKGSDSDNLPPLIIDTSATSTPTTVSSSNKSSPGSVSTYSISPGSQAGLTMCIRTNSTEGLQDAGRCEETESSSESSEGGSTSGSSDGSSTVDDDSSSTSGSATISDTEDTPRDTAGRKSSRKDTDKSRENKKGSPGTSGGIQKPKPRKERHLSGEKSKIAGREATHSDHSQTWM